jgi:hypothetical protein
VLGAFCAKLVPTRKKAAATRVKIVFFIFFYLDF